jgi:drug/metabolite transporter (DMT)-like permease
VQAGAQDSVGAATAIAAHLPPEAASSLLADAGDAFTQAMGIGLGVAAALAAATAVVVVRFLPAREEDVAQVDRESLDLQPQN